MPANADYGALIECYEHALRRILAKAELAPDQTAAERAIANIAHDALPPTDGSGT